MGDQIGQLLEPEQGDPGQQAALVGDTGLQGVVVGADPVGGQHQHLGGGGGIHAGGHVQLAGLAADDRSEERRVGKWCRSRVTTRNDNESAILLTAIKLTSRKWSNNKGSYI